MCQVTPTPPLGEGDREVLKTRHTRNLSRSSSRSSISSQGKHDESIGHYIDVGYTTARVWIEQAGLMDPVAHSVLFNLVLFGAEEKERGRESKGEGKAKKEKRSVVRG